MSVLIFHRAHLAPIASHRDGVKKTISQFATERLTQPSYAQPSHSEPLTATLTWIPHDAPSKKATRTLFASPAILSEELYSAHPIRAGNRYPGQKNFHGYYFFSQTGRHVWHESLLEATTMRWLDLNEDIVGITSQPCRIDFSDGTFHIPDLLAVHADHRQVLYDVKPTKFLPDARAQFAKTRALCEEIGWGYAVHSELPEQVRISLEWVSHFRHPLFHPGVVAAGQLLEQMTPETNVRVAAQLLGLPTLAEGRSAVYHLVAIRVLSVPLDVPLSDRTIVKRGTNAHA
jgi:hypothetical protein